VAGLVTGLVLALVYLPARPSGRPAPPPPARPLVMSSETVQATSASSLPGKLDAQWAAVSAGSNCAGWAGGDGISAVRLSATQVAWFFSDSYLGPAGPDPGLPALLRPDPQLGGDRDRQRQVTPVHHADRRQRVQPDR
jgi:hypothetical protein